MILLTNSILLLCYYDNVIADYKLLDQIAVIFEYHHLDLKYINFQYRDSVFS